MDEQKQSHSINDYLDEDTDPAIRRLKPSVPSRAVVPKLKEQHVPVQIEPEQREIQQEFVSGSLQIQQEIVPESIQKQQHVCRRRPGKWVLVVACVLTTLLFLGLISFVFFKVFFTVHDVTAFRIGHQKMVIQYIGGGGIIRPRQQVTVSYPAPLHIVDVLVKEGDHVKQGQALIKLDTDQVNAQINRAQDDVNAAQNYLNSVAAAGNTVAIAGANQALEQAQSRFKALQAQTSSLLHDDQLISPIRGVVTNLNASPGLQFGTNVSLLTVVDQSSVLMRAKIPLENLSQVHMGMSALVTPSALPNQTFNGTVISITPQADPLTDTFQVDVQVSNTQQMLLTGMSAFVRIEGQVNAFVVPRLAVLNPDRESSVFEIRNGHAYIKAVHVAGRSPNDVYVDDGLRSNDLIVLLPLQRMRQGQEVNVVRMQQ